MEYCGWGDLAMKIKRYIKRREYIDERVIWVYLIQILEGLKALHERNVLHRDLKPANCFLAEDGSIKIGDMNVSKVMKDGNAKTQIGTPYYMSPEIWSRKPYNYATDIWSLGCLIYELCALRPPFLGNNMNELKTAVLGGHFNPIPSVYSHDLGVVIGRMLTPSAKERPTAAQALAYVEVQARKCLVKNVLREEDLSSCGGGPASEEALMPTIHIGSLRELGLKLPGPSYPTDGPATPTTPIALAHDASPVNEEALPMQPPISVSPSNRGRVAASSSSSSSSSSSPSASSSGSSSDSHRRQGSAVPVSMERNSNSGAATPPPLSYDRRRSHDVPPSSIPKLGYGVPAGAEDHSGRRSPVSSGSSSRKPSSPAHASSSSSSSGRVTPVGEVHYQSGGVDSNSNSNSGLEKKSSVKSVLQAAQKEVESPSRRR